MTPEQLSRYKDLAIEKVMTYAPQLALALLTLFIGNWLIRRLVMLVEKGLQVRHVDPTLAPFLKSLIGWILRIVLVLSVASMIGVQTTSFVAILGAAGLAVGLALQGSLSNFAGGVLILIFRPYRVGDSITAQGQTGVVREIQIFTTVLLNSENRRVILPNGALANGAIINLTAEQHVRVVSPIVLPQTADLRRAKALLLELLPTLAPVLPEPPPAVGVASLGTPGVPASHLVVHLNLAVSVKPADAASTPGLVLEAAKYKLEEAGIHLV
ncbi:MAG TPA: mechanosensitive ion channel domain-containing protein [Polyangiaceae bacterium]|nr:mechanosensitive ion channel domain-containing protein [Polyangiaceae bacterium]